MRGELSVGAAERVAGAGREIGEGHAVGTADSGFEVMHLACETVRREPFGFGVSIEKGTIDALRCGTKDAVKTNGMGVSVHDERVEFGVQYNDERNSGGRTF